MLAEHAVSTRFTICLIMVQSLTYKSCAVNKCPVCRLIFAGKQMHDDKSAKEYNIEGGSVLHLVGQVPGTLGTSCSKLTALS